MHPLIASLPLLLLVLAMTVRAPRLRLPVPAFIGLSIAAVLALAVQVFAAPSPDPTALAARVIEGLLTALMPLSIVFGAIVLFRTLTASGALDTIVARLETSTPDPVLRVVLIAWSFSYLIEGLSGFGTPAALAAPLLVGMRFPPIRAAAACLVMNTAPVVFGAVGTSIWFGLDGLGLDTHAFRDLRISAALATCVVAPAVVLTGLRMLFSWSEIRSRLVPVLLIVAATAGSSVLVATVSPEFPSIVGGLVGLAATLLLGRLPRFAQAPPSAPPSAPKLPLSLGRAMTPLAATVALLALTRIEPLGIKALLNADSPAVSVSLGGLGELSVSAAVVTRLDNILGSDMSWSMPVMYVPFILPFLVVSLAAAPIVRLPGKQLASEWAGAARGLRLPAVALAGALVFVKLMVHGGDSAPVVTLGRTLADAVGGVHESLWIAGAPIVGALGSFFSGSATVSNLTFGHVQAEIAASLGLDRSTVLALQAVGAAIGNMACIHNIVAVVAVLGITQQTHAGTADEDGRPRPTSDDPVGLILRMNLVPLGIALATTVLAASAIAVT